MYNYIYINIYETEADISIHIYVYIYMYRQIDRYIDRYIDILHRKMEQAIKEKDNIPACKCYGLTKAQENLGKVSQVLG